ncbi:hypothetical protein EGR_10013 [Echinococcus granulosus]|uniref:Uncharacterized protein n=1 Tax=Echinococcus granulosus TaxID=6210 RepID=W6U1Z9_ECHGR|nr:hypothetical protein EGR_10013 [Echinococcus granulosus]EUB55130.1 hypothetical protein EGR_10013 [Echinococcus granulosus]
MFEVRQGTEASVREHAWPYSRGPTYRFQVIDHVRNAAPHDASSSTEKTDLETRIWRLCASLQSVLERSRTKKRWSRRDKIFPTYTTCCQCFFQPYEQDVSRADMYLDSGGNLHGPLDLKHSSKLDGMRKSGGSFIKRSWVEGQRSQSSTRSEGRFKSPGFSGSILSNAFPMSLTLATQESPNARSDAAVKVVDNPSLGHAKCMIRSSSTETFPTIPKVSKRSSMVIKSHHQVNDPVEESGANYQTLDGYRSRTYSESRGHVSAEIDGLLDDLNRMRHRENLSNRTSMTRWSSLGTVRGDGGRYSTTLIRRHMKRGREPVDVYLQKPLTSNLSKVDLLSVDNRSVLRVSPVTLQEENRSSAREQRLIDELMETRRELQRTRSMMSEDGKRGLNYGSTLKVPINNEASRNHSMRAKGKFEIISACMKLSHERSLYK